MSRSRWRDARLAACRRGAGHGRDRRALGPADTAALRGCKRHAKTDKTDARHLRALLGGRLPECWIPPAQILEHRALLETYHDLRRAHTAWVQRIHAVFFHQGAPPLGEERCAPSRAWPTGGGRGPHLSPAGQQQVATALDMLAATEAQLGPLRHQLRDAPGISPARRYWPRGCTASAPSPRWR